MNPLFPLFEPAMITSPTRSTPKRRPRCAWLLPALLLAAISFAHAKSAEDYFREASYHYVAGKIQEASVEAEEGLRANPDDARLRALAEHLRKMKDEQRGGSGGDKGQDDKQKDGKQDPKDRNDDSRNDNKDDKNEGKKGGDRNTDERDESGNGNKPPEEDRDEDRDGEGERPQPRKMSEEEAKRLLNSFADDEKKEQAERRKVIRSRAGTEQDW